MIINFGNRTDIPAWYSRWFYNRISEGYVMARNPYSPNQITKFNLDPKTVDILAFITKNPEPMLDRIDEIDAFGQLWQVTITSYGQDIEPYVPSADKVINSFKRLSKKIGKNAVVWRYDPIFINEKYSLNFHIQAFEQMAKKLEGYTDICVISFVDLYEKTKKNFKGIRAVSKKEQEQITSQLVEIAKRYSMALMTCCEDLSLENFGADTSGCMGKNVLEHALGVTLDIPKKDFGGRNGCFCVIGNDVGMYNTCGHGCLYCYANYDRKTVKSNMKKHNPNSSLLVGELYHDDIVKEAKAVSYKNMQVSLFDL